MRRSVLALVLCCAIPAWANNLLILAVALGNDSKVSVDAYEFKENGGALIAHPSTWEAVGIILNNEEKASEKLSTKDLGVSYTIDFTLNVVRLNVPGVRRPAQVIGKSTNLAPFGTPAKGVLINYDLAFFYTKRGFDLSLGHEFRRSLFGGSLSTYGLFSQEGYIRNTTTWTKDDLEKGRVLQIGDVFSTASNLGGLPSFLGFRYASDPALVSTSEAYIPRLGGVLDQRSTVELYVQGQLQSTHELEAGPFSFAQIPIITGTNRVEVVIKDQFGREQRFERSWFYNPSLLSKGKSDWDVSFGKPRTFSSYGNDIGASIFYRRGLGNRWTASLSTQFDKNGRQVVVGNTFAISDRQYLTSDFGMSKSTWGTGNAGSLTYTFEPNSVLSVSASHQQSDNWWNLGQEEGKVFQATQTLAVRYRPSLSNWSLGGSLVRYERDEENASLANFNMSWASGNHAIAVAMGYDFKESESQTFLTYTYRFGSSSQASFRAGKNQFGTDVSVVASGQREWKYNPLYWSAVVANNQSFTQGGIQASTRLPKVNVDLRLTSMRDGYGINGRLSGSLYMEPGLMSWQKPIYDSFIVVDTKLKDIPITINNQPHGKTNTKGKIIISAPSLQNVKVRTKPEELPFNIIVVGENAPVSIPRSSGVFVEFNGLRKLVEVRVVNSEGKPLPVGTYLKHPSGEEALIGSDGRASLTVAFEGQEGEWKTESPTLDCSFIVKKGDEDVVCR